MNPFIRDALSSGVQRQKPTSTIGLYDQGLTDALTKGVGAGYVGLNVGLPIVKNNLQYADDFINTANVVSDTADFLGNYNNYQTILGLADPSTGSQAFGSALGAGTLGQNFVNNLLMSNPVSGGINVLNQLTANQKNPYGAIPLVSDFSQFISTTADRMNASPLGRGISNIGASIFGNTVGRLTDNAVGRGVFNIATLPMTGVEGLFGTLREGYQSLDRNLFDGALFGGADPDDPESMQFDNPFKPMLDVLEGIPDSFRTEKQIDLDAQYETLTDQVDADVRQKGAIDAMIEKGVDRYDAIDKVLNTSPAEIATFLADTEMSNKEVSDIASALSGRSIDDLDPKIIDPTTGMFVEPEKFFDPNYDVTQDPDFTTSVAGQPSSQDFVDIALQDPIVEADPTNIANNDAVIEQARINASVANMNRDINNSIRDFSNRDYITIAPTPQPQAGSYNLFGYRPF